MYRAEPIKTGTWAKIAPKTYQHVSGIVVRYDCNRWSWEIVGSCAHDGYLYKTLTVAQHMATEFQP